MIKVGSLFAGLGGFEKGIEDAFDGMAETVWQVEQNSFCQKVLKKHWPNATIYDDVRTVGKHNLEPVHILCGGFPCQDISVAGKQRGIHESKKSSLWWEMHRLISELQPRIAFMENVANVLSVGGPHVIGSLAEIGYDCEWTVVRSGSDFGAPHHRARWFCVAYPSGSFAQRRTKKPWSMGQKGKTQLAFFGCPNMSTLWNNKRPSDWTGIGTESAICRMDDGLSTGLDKVKFTRIRKERLKALGNAIVPQASEWVARQVLNSGLLDDLLEGEQ